MKLTLFTDYSMRVMFYLASHPDRLCSIAEVASAYQISQNHLMKVVNELARLGYINSVRGRGGGIKLGMPADEIRIGEIVRQTEAGFELVDCSGCTIEGVCKLTCLLKEALSAFLKVLDKSTLEELALGPSDFDVGALK